MSQYDKIAASRPVDRNTALSMSGGETFVSRKKVMVPEWDTPPKLAILTRRERNNPSLVDLTGRSFGRLRVVGPMRTESQKLTWLCRCSCGKYCTRSGKAVTNPANDQDRCQQCLHIAYLKRFDSPEQRAARKAQGMSY